MVDLELGLANLIAFDRIGVVSSSLDNKIKKRKPVMARDLEINGKYDGDRFYARVETSNENKARGMKEGVARFCEEFPREGKVLEGYIAEQRLTSETHMYFGTQPGKRLTGDDYMGVLTQLGFSEGMARNMYPALIEASRKIKNARDEVERSVMIGSKTF